MGSAGAAPALPASAVPVTTMSRISIVLTVLGMALLIGSASVWSLTSQQDRPVGAVAQVESALSAPLEESPSPTPQSPVPASEATLTASSLPWTSIAPQEVAMTQVAPLESRRGAAPAPAPITLTIESLGIEAPIGSYGVDARGQMEVPDSVSEVAWYRWGPSPGEQGSAVLAAHVDLAGQGAGVFFNLNQLEPGAIVIIDYEDGSAGAFEVAARVAYDKDELPLEVIFSRQGSPVVTLITCGGGFDRSSQRYDSNVVVYAVPTVMPAASPG